MEHSHAATNSSPRAAWRWKRISRTQRERASRAAYAKFQAADYPAAEQAWAGVAETFPKEPLAFANWATVLIILASDGMSLAFNDTDGDGAVSEAEFIGKSGDWMELLDRNGDGVVTTDDFGRH